MIFGLHNAGPPGDAIAGNFPGLELLSICHNLLGTQTLREQINVNLHKVQPALRSHDGPAALPTSTRLYTSFGQQPESLSMRQLILRWHPDGTRRGWAGRPPG